MTQLEETCWRGIQVHCPAQWEASRLCGPDEPGRCTFADRRHERMDLRWREVKYVPNLDLMLDKYRKKSKKTKLSELTGAPPDWRGLVHKSREATVVHAGRFFRSARLLMEATIVWPGKRNTQIEWSILASVAPNESKDGVRRWQALGISLAVAERFELVDCNLQVGRVIWNFQTTDKPTQSLTVERIAMPDAWLDTSLRDWLQEELPEGSKAGRQDPRKVNNHRGEQLISRPKAGRVGFLRRLRPIRLDVAWQCPVEGRLYRVAFTDMAGGEEIDLPAHLLVRCCRQPPPVAT